MKENRLIIKNFGPIKHIDIPIRKINVLIGDQGTGKSTVAKVLACLISAEFLLLYKSTKFNLFEKYKLNNFLEKKTYIELQQNGVKITYDNKKFDVHVNNSANSEFLKFLNNYTKLINSIGSTDKNDFLLGFRKGLANFPNVSCYIPSERNIITSIGNSPFTFFNSIQISNYLLEYGEIYDNARKNYNQLNISEFGITFKHINSKDYLELNNKTILLDEAASGLQNIIPIYLILTNQKKDDVMLNIIEEPEISLFPPSQNKLVKHLVETSLIKGFDLLLTTHSPYVLTTLNNLIYAHKIGSIRGKGAKATKIIEKRYWLNPKDVSAYILNEKGEAEDLMDYEINQIKAERIDEISRVINKEFDELLNIEFST